MHLPFSYRIKDQQLWLSPDRCIFWEEEKSLIVSDLHFGKTGHFRKSGIGVPQAVYKEDLQRLLAQIQYFQPRQLLVVGDLFHSRENKELQLFQRWRNDLAGLAVRLIMGNHDILGEAWYREAGIEVIPEQLQIGDFLFVHDIEDADVGARPAVYPFSGHIHPGIRINGMGRQSIHLPCFYFGASYAVLPAFSRFTGTVSIQPERDDEVFAIIGAETAARGAGMTGSPSRMSGRAATILQIQ
jgi:DNA ligase-associated metallophosphoesterase